VPELLASISFLYLFIIFVSCPHCEATHQFSLIMAAESLSVSSAAIESWIGNVEHNDATLEHNGHELPPTPTSNSFESEERRGRKRRRTLCDIDFGMSKCRIDPPASDLRSISDADFSLPLSPTTLREPSRKRSQSPTKVHNELALCDPAIRHESADYTPLHPTTKSKIKKLIQYLADESKIITEAEKASVVMCLISECNV
jgi:hypothetical protein